MTPLSPDSEVLVWIGLRRVHTGRVTNHAGRWLDAGRPVPSYLPDTLDQLALAGLLTLADPSPADTTRRASLTTTGEARYAQLHERYRRHRARAELQVPDPQFPTNTGRAPVEPEALPPSLAFAPKLPAPGRRHHLVYWAPDEHGQLHAVDPADALLSTARGYTQTRCELVHLPANTDLATDPSGPLCQACAPDSPTNSPDANG